MRTHTICFGVEIRSGPEVIKKVFMLISAGYDILDAHKYKNIMKFSFVQVQISLECYFSCL